MELLPPAKRGRPYAETMSPAGDINLSRKVIGDLRKVYGGLPAEQLAELKAKAVETGEPLSRAAVERVVGRFRVGVSLEHPTVVGCSLSECALQSFYHQGPADQGALPGASRWYKDSASESALNIVPWCNVLYLSARSNLCTTRGPANQRALPGASRWMGRSGRQDRAAQIGCLRYSDREPADRRRFPLAAPLTASAAETRGDLLGRGSGLRAQGSGLRAARVRRSGLRTPPRASSCQRAARLRWVEQRERGRPSGSMAAGAAQSRQRP